MSDLVVILIVALVVGLALAYIIREKKRGVKCVGCPYAKNCGSCHGSCSSQNK